MAYPGYEGYASADPYSTGYAYAPPPAYGHAAPYGGEDLRTVFITGFPQDVKERELNNLLRFLPGYEASQMYWKGGQAQGFALFAHGGAARAACDSISGLCFDDGVFLRSEMAHKNMYIKDNQAAKRSRTSGGYTGTTSGGGGGGGASGRPVGYAPIGNAKDNAPCNTLFVGNLGDGVEENELQGLFSQQPGFIQLKVLRNSRNVSCFVEFDSIETATSCHQNQQGAVLTTSDRGGIRIQFSRNPFGKKRDVNGNMVDMRQLEQGSGGSVPAGGAQPDGAGGYNAPPGNGAAAYEVNAPPGTAV